MLTAMSDIPVERIAPEDALSVNTARAAKILGISRRQIYNLLEAGEIASSKIPSSKGKPNLRLIKISELKAFLERYQGEDYREGTPAA